MAKDIKPTPVLYNEEAKAFIKKVEKNKDKKVSKKTILAIKKGAAKLQAMYVAR